MTKEIRLMKGTNTCRGFNKSELQHTFIPITPQSELLEYFADKHLKEFYGITTESEVLPLIGFWSCEPVKINDFFISQELAFDAGRIVLYSSRGTSMFNINSERGGPD
jgi:lipopolysaccharide biosynthesis protein